MSYTVHFEPSGHQVEVADGERVLTAALRHGLQLPYSCRGGACGACKAQIIEGDVDYPDGDPQGLNAQERAIGMTLLCSAVPIGDLRIEVHEVTDSEELEVKTLPCRIVKKEQLNHDVLRLFLKLPDNQRLQFLAGQYIDFLLEDGRRRAFSLANAPHRDELLELHIRLVPDGDFTDFLFHQAEEKTILRVKGPLGQFTLREDSERPMIMMAGGTGFAPIKAILEHAFAEELQQPIYLYWGARAKQDLYLDKLPKRWIEKHPNLHYIPVLSEPQADDDWQGATGFVHDAVLANHPDLSNVDVYSAGPPAMVEAGAVNFERAGLPMDHYYSDAFTYAKDK